MGKKNKKKKKKSKQYNENTIDGRITEDNFLSAVIDHKNRQLRAYSNDMLIKRYNRDAKKIAKSFDKICKNEVVEISKLYSKCLFTISDGFLRSVDARDEFAIECGKLLMNASKTIQASVELIRVGYILQPGMLLRSVVEVFSLISYMHIEQDGFEKFKDGKVDVNKTIKYGKQILPPIGQFQGLLSNQFVHISELHSEFNNITEYKEMIEPLKINLNLIRVSIWLSAIISELVFYEYFEEHDFWNRKSKYEYELKIQDNISDWMGVESLKIHDI